MDYYHRKALFSKDLRTYIMDEKNAGKKASLANLEIIYSQRYGFSLKQLLAALRPYERLGYALVTEDSLFIIGKDKGKRIIESTSASVGKPATQ